MNFDLRFPIGFMFSVYGAMLAIFGVLANHEIYDAHSLGLNINLGWGLVLLVFGVSMLALAWRAKSNRSSDKDI
jgi:hypothetical protein